MGLYRQILDSQLKAICNNVYFQPPQSVKMIYPCIRYELDSESVRYADNSRYKHHKRYKITVIDRDPDSTIPDEVAKLIYCSFDRPYVADGLNHWVYHIYI